MNSNKHFYDSSELKELTQLTWTLCSIPKKTYRRHKSAESYWREMMLYWKNNEAKIGCNVVYAALYGIHWGVYPEDTPANPDLRRLIDLLKAEFLKINTDLECAKDKLLFSSSLEKVLKSKSPHSRKKWNSETYELFLEAKTKLRLYGGEIVVQKLNLLETSEDDFAAMREKAKTREICEKMKRHIIKMLPMASTWSDDAFSNDATIVSLLQSTYGVDQEWCNKNFDVLIRALECMEENHAQSYILLELTDLPLSLAAVIWPQNTEKNMEKLFCGVYRMIAKYAKFTTQAGGTYSESLMAAQKNLQDSWLYRQITEWREEHTHTLSQETRSCYFNVALGIFE